MTDDARLSPWFWELLVSSQRNLRALCRQLEQLPPEQLRRFQLEYDDAKDLVNPYGWEEFPEDLSDDCSEDHADDYAAWVVMQGREFFERVLANPDEINEHLDLFSDVAAGLSHLELRWPEEAARRRSWRDT